MKVCVIVEGAYPYVTGGVSSWLQSMMLEFKDIDFVIQTIVIDRKQKNKMKYQIPPNVSEIHETYLFDHDYNTSKSKIKLTQVEYDAFKSLFYGVDIQWEAIFDFFYGRQVSLDQLLKSKDFLELTKSYYIDHYHEVVFTDFLWSMRSMYQPLFTIFRTPPIKADLYHSLSTGYSGILGSMGKVMENKPFVLSEHGIYTREREEELIKANWVKEIYKDLWIDQFYKLSACSYKYADQVTALSGKASQIQIELGCQRSKTNVIANGVDMDWFVDLVQKDPGDGFINVGALLRVAPIKDVKTMINAFYLAKIEEPRLKLWIMGPMDEDPEYTAECQELVSDLGLKDVVFTGTIKIRDYLGKMDFMILSSLSEGQPLVILEAFAAKKPFIATNVGDCKNLIYGEEDEFGEAGIVVPLMNTKQMSQAIIKLARSPELRETMGMSGYNRVNTLNKKEDIYNKYYKLYMGLKSNAIKPELRPEIKPERRHRDGRYRV